MVEIITITGKTNTRRTPAIFRYFVGMLCPAISTTSLLLELDLPLDDFFFRGNSSSSSSALTTASLLPLLPVTTLLLFLPSGSGRRLDFFDEPEPDFFFFGLAVSVELEIRSFSSALATPPVAGPPELAFNA